MKLRKIDLFACANALLFVLLCVFRYHARFVAYRGAAHIEEFFIYAAAILLAIGVLWRAFRRYHFNGTTLALLELGILMHFAGAFVQIDQQRLYDHAFVGMRYDKYVHFVNAFAATLLVCRLMRILRIPSNGFHAVFAVLVVLGMGAVVEIVEYLVVLTVPANGVGGYDNNMQDLIANLAGACVFMAARAARRLLGHRLAGVLHGMERPPPLHALGQARRP